MGSHFDGVIVAESWQCPDLIHLRLVIVQTVSYAVHKSARAREQRVLPRRPLVKVEELQAFGQHLGPLAYVEEPLVRALVGGRTPD
jgi:hypothetical protein